MFCFRSVGLFLPGQVRFLLKQNKQLSIKHFLINYVSVHVTSGTRNAIRVVTKPDFGSVLGLVNRPIRTAIRGSGSKVFWRSFLAKYLRKCLLLRFFVIPLVFRQHLTPDISQMTINCTNFHSFLCKRTCLYLNKCFCRETIG